MNQVSSADLPQPASDISIPAIPQPTVFLPGEQLGHFTLVELIAQGGMGEVWKAEQLHPLRRTVAIKVIKARANPNSILARFESERRILTLMDHPFIAKVLEAGATSDGYPYFVMEYVVGLDITTFCKKNNVNLNQKLKLFIAVCDAIHHAHQKGIIHRDIKPTNILVTGTSSNPIPKVIDFGIAKAMDQAISDRTMITRFGDLIGTPEFMSPEQANLSATDVDTRSDIYSLGVLLYALLTGTTPLKLSNPKNLPLDELLRNIREKDPARPSAVVSQQIQHPTGDISKTEPNTKTLVKQLRGDLDWIAMKALEKERHRRYQSVFGLSEDIVRFLNKQPVEARPPSRFYRTRKAIARNPMAFVGLFSTMVVLVIGLAISGTLLRREHRARLASDKAQAAELKMRNIAQLETATSEEISQFLQDIIESVDPAIALGKDISILQSILDRTEIRISSQTHLPLAVEARIRTSLGKAYHEVGDWEKAAIMRERVLEIRRSEKPVDQRQLALALNEMGMSEVLRKNWARGQQFYEEAIGIQRTLAKDYPLELSTTLNNLGNVLGYSKDSSAAEAALHESLHIRRNAIGSNDVEVITTLGNLAGMLAERNRGKEAVRFATEAMSIATNIVPRHHPMTVMALSIYAKTLSFTGDFEKAYQLIKEANAIRNELYHPQHPEIAKGLVAEASHLLNSGKTNKHAMAESLLRDALVIERKTSRSLTGGTQQARSLLNALLMDQKRYEEAGAMLKQEAESLRKTVGLDHVETARAYGEWIGCLRKAKQFKEAESILNELLVPPFTTNANSASYFGYRANLFAQTAQWIKAREDYLTKSLHLSADAWQNNHFYAGALIASGDIPALRQLCPIILQSHKFSTDPGDLNRAVKACLTLVSTNWDIRTADALADRTLELAVNHPLLAIYQATKALSYYRLGQFSESRQWAEMARKAYDEPPPGGFTPSPSFKAQNYAVLAMASAKLDDKPSAKLALEAGNELFNKVFPNRPIQDYGSAWLDWVYAETLLKEASEILK